MTRVWIYYSGMTKFINSALSRVSSVAVLATLIPAGIYGQSTESQRTTDEGTANRTEPTEAVIQPDIPRSSDPGKQPFVRTFFHDEYRMWTSPFRPGNYDSHTMKKYVLPFVLIAGTLIATDRRVAHALPNTEDQTTWSRRVSQIGAPYSLAAYSGGLYLISRMTGDKHAREAGWLGLEAIGHSQLIVFIMKEATQRERPQTDEARKGFWRGGDSFPSGHAAGSFALASVFAYEYRDHIAVPITAYTLATAVSLSRMSARKHWFSDVFVGGSMGFLIGRYVYKTHHNPDLPGSPVHNRFSRLMPEFGVSDRGLTLQWKL